MSPRQFGHRDRSTAGMTADDPWACRSCPYRHEPGALCPAPGVWLVLALCPACDERTGRYCAAHRGKGPAENANANRRARPGEE